MKRRHWKLVGLVVLVGVMVCAETYAGRSKKKKIRLPDAVKAAISAFYPTAVIEEAKVEKEGLKLYEIELKLNGQEFEVTVAPDGTIIEIESEVAIDGLPDAVKAAITKAAGGAEIEDIKEEVTYWVVTLKKLETPETTYEAELIKDGSEVEIELAADGTILEQKVKDKDDDDEDDDEGDDDEDEQEVSIEQVPAAVKATILEEAQGGTIKEIERETEDGKTIYEAEVIINGEEVEIEVAADGTLLSKEVEDDDDEDDDD
jgi:uncharacterized membrane protein YkoI